MLLVVGACGGDSPTSPNLDFDNADTVALQGGSTLVLQNAAAFGEHRGTIEQVVKDTLAAASERIPLNGITILVQPGTQNVIPEIGIGGRADTGTVRVTLDTNSSEWIPSLDSELFPLLAHELHHVARLRAVGFYDHLLDAMVAEGLADQFSVELARIPPPLWSSALTPAQLETWSERAEAEWFNGSYDHNAWFFGTSSIPRWAGYTIGFVITGEYIAADRSRSAASLYAEPSPSFVSAE